LFMKMVSEKLVETIPLTGRANKQGRTNGDMPAWQSLQPTMPFLRKQARISVPGRSSGSPGLRTPSHLLQTVALHPETLMCFAAHRDHSYGDSAGFSPASLLIGISCRHDTAEPNTARR
jgi:hypothetical protein